MASPVGPLYQDPAQRNWGSQLEPGIYPTLVDQSEHELCVINQAGGLREVTAFYGTTIAIGPSSCPSRAGLAGRRACQARFGPTWEVAGA